MQLLNFNIIRLFLFLVIGIVIGHFYSTTKVFPILAAVILLVMVGLTWLSLRHKLVKHPFFAILTYSTMVFIGYTSYCLNIDFGKANHYSSIYRPNTTSSLTLEIEKRLKPDQFNEKYIANMTSLNGHMVFGKILVNLKRDSNIENLAVDDNVSVATTLVDIQGPLNPYQFNYEEYLRQHNVYLQIYLDPSNIVSIEKGQSTLFGYADKVRTKINQHLLKAGFKPDTLGIINAMLLGQRQDIDKDIYNNYINSGTIHILAVSGLHVGIILLILNALFKPLLLLKYGHVIRPVLILVLLWLFALIAGFTPSVTRAVTMFSLISVAMHLKRPTNIYNTLVISAFLILLIKPSFLFQVGFQMSYMAVLGIVSIQPILYKLLSVKFWVFDKLWQIFTVTIAAQIGVIPISLYYFHQFPGLFFLSNLVVIPFLGLILGLGLLVIVLSLLNSLPQILAEVYGLIIESLNAFIAWVATFEEFLLKDISFHLLQVFICYLLVILFLQFYKSKSAKWLVLSLVCVIGFQLSTSNFSSNTSKALIIFNKSRHTVIGLKNQSDLSIHHNLDSVGIFNDNIVKNYKVGASIKTISTSSLKSVYKIEDDVLFVVDSLGVYHNLSFKPSYVLLRNSPKVNLERLIDSLKPKILIADASNYTSYVNRWNHTANQKKVDFFYTKDNGAYILQQTIP